MRQHERNNRLYGADSTSTRHTHPEATSNDAKAQGAADPRSQDKKMRTPKDPHFICLVSEAGFEPAHPVCGH